MNVEYVVRLTGDLELAPKRGKADVDPEQVGVKAARLAELAREGVRVAEGFAVTAAAYREFVHEAGLKPTIAEEIRRLHAGRDLVVVAADIRSAFRDAPLPLRVVDEILDAYQDLGGDGTEVAVRCSPMTSADVVPDEVFLHLTTGHDVLAACRRCFASLYGAVAVGKREAEGIDHLKVMMPVTVQRGTV
ncbi:pyruvate phosphate dikinase-like enzyme [Kribbella sp. VKM Ac-2569]|uniref:PEP/pyruvate-binding domain-containing protein n=1 Tax=Kribbella sp. VKM Ac-2569 TaxID=2512220 RepID=UPI00102B4819|nr:PEP/pyruvate-binding domain-containing protein [Kribbella sp. VKM Ac-2569]RZT16760.1 pyruvate phosphate dikinase-like enzyme [Kribbella sp. VKM Ac-2569]